MAGNCNLNPVRFDSPLLIYLGMFLFGILRATLSFLVYQFLSWQNKIIKQNEKIIGLSSLVGENQQDSNQM